MEVVVSRPTEARIQHRTVCAVALLVRCIVGTAAPLASLQGATGDLKSGGPSEDSLSVAAFQGCAIDLSAISRFRTLQSGSGQADPEQRPLWEPHFASQESTTEN
jgi:hypothetical protein